jgi:16S rRNA (guanine527-N7)-methyltransferase
LKEEGGREERVRVDRGKLMESLAQLGLKITDEQAEKLIQYVQLLLEFNKKMNLTAITEEEEIISKHLCDSLALMKTKGWPVGETEVLDLGTGPGFPGIPLKIVNPLLNMALLDSKRKKIEFLHHAVDQLELSKTKVLLGRAEDLAREIRYREKFDLVVSRAVAALPVLMELSLPFVRLGGMFVAYKGPEGRSEVKEAEKALEILGGKVEEVHDYQLPDDRGERMLVCIKKNELTPLKYPRKAGIPSKRPLK